MIKHLLGGVALLAVSATPALAERVYFNNLESEGTRGTLVNQRSLKTLDVSGRVDVITPVNRFGYAPRSTFLDLGGGLIGGSISPKESFAFKPGDLVTISFDASGNQLRPTTSDYFQLQLDVTGLVGQGAEQGYFNVSDLGGTGAFSFVDYPCCFDPPLDRVRIYEKYFASWGGFGLAGSFPGGFPWTSSSLYFVAQDLGRIDFDLSTIFGGYGPLIDNIAIDITPTGYILPPEKSDAASTSSRPSGSGPAVLRGLLSPAAAAAAATVPAPGSLALFGLGLTAAGVLRRRARRQR